MGVIDFDKTDCPSRGGLLPGSGFQVTPRGIAVNGERAAISLDIALHKNAPTAEKLRVFQLRQLIPGHVPPIAVRQDSNDVLSRTQMFSKLITIIILKSWIAARRPAPDL